MSRVHPSEEAATASDLVSSQWLAKLDQAPADAAARRQLAASWQRPLVLKQLERLARGGLQVSEHGRRWNFGDRHGPGPQGELNVRNSRFYRMAVMGGDVGAAEAYLRGYWDSPDLAAAMDVFAANLSVLKAVGGPGRRLLQPWARMTNWLRRNTVAGSRRNIAAHYDLSNEFFALWLDRSMTYSSGLYVNGAVTLEEASREKYDRICRRLKISSNDHVLEIGTGWGGFAEYAAMHYGCRVTTTTISQQQYAYATHRIREASLSGRVQLLREDYRQLTGAYDKIVSIEMIEAVGARYLGGYFRKCCQLLKPGGAMMLQSIVMPESRYGAYCRSNDFIKTYIFPGGHLPSVGALGQAVGEGSDLRFEELHAFGGDYARTLAAWRKNFWEQIESIRQLGFDQRFVRMWNYYLAYCEAAFAQQQIDVVQLKLHRPRA